jgi:hypothetical protein
MGNIQSYLATVVTVYPIDKELPPYDTKGNPDLISIYNKNRDFSNSNARFYGAIKYSRENMTTKYYAYPFDKNNFTMPINGETVLILEVDRNNIFWLPYSVTPYSNYRRSYPIFKNTQPTDVTIPSDKNKDGENLRKVTNTGGQTELSNTNNFTIGYSINERIKFLNPKQGDTIISGRVGNTIRFSELHLTEDGKTPSPAIFIRNKQNPELDSKKIGELVDEDINKDGTSIYITSNKVKVPFKEEIKKDKIAFKEFPNSKDLSGDQLFVNSDRVVLSSKANEFIIFGKGNTGVITDGNFSIDAEEDIYLHTNNNVTIHSAGANQIFLNSENGKIYLGKNQAQNEGEAGSDVQNMVLGGELVKLLGELIDVIIAQVYATCTGPTAADFLDIQKYKAIKSKLNTILSAKNYLSKS